MYLEDKYERIQFRFFVVMPAYQVDKFLEEAVDCIIHQSIGSTGFN